jgi:hypothetical protein
MSIGFRSKNKEPSIHAIILITVFLPYFVVLFCWEFIKPIIIYPSYWDFGGLGNIALIIIYTSTPMISLFLFIILLDRRIQKAAKKVDLLVIDPRTIGAISGILTVAGVLFGFGITMLLYSTTLVTSYKYAYTWYSLFFSLYTGLSLGMLVGRFHEFCYIYQKWVNDLKEKALFEKKKK